MCDITTSQILTQHKPGCRTRAAQTPARSIVMFQHTGHIVFAIQQVLGERTFKITFLFPPNWLLYFSWKKNISYSEKAPDCRVNFTRCITHKYLLPNPQSCQYVFTLNNLDLGHHFVLHLFQCVLSCSSISVQAKCLVFPLRPGQFPASVSLNKTSYKQRLFPARHCIVGTKACRYLKFPTLKVCQRYFHSFCPMSFLQNISSHFPLGEQGRK